MGKAARLKSPADADAALAELAQVRHQREELENSLRRETARLAMLTDRLDLPFQERETELLAQLRAFYDTHPVNHTLEHGSFGMQMGRSAIELADGVTEKEVCHTLAEKLLAKLVKYLQNLRVVPGAKCPANQLVSIAIKPNRDGIQQAIKEQQLDPARLEETLGLRYRPAEESFFCKTVPYVPPVEAPPSSP